MDDISQGAQVTQKRPICDQESPRSRPYCTESDLLEHDDVTCSVMGMDAYPQGALPREACPSRWGGERLPWWHSG